MPYQLNPFTGRLDKDDILSIAAGDNITLSSSGSTVTISGASGGGAGSNTLGISNIGNTSGTSGVVSGSSLQLLLAGGNNVTLSQSIDGVSVTVTVSANTIPPIGTAVNDVATAGSTGTITRFAPEDHRHRGLNQFQITGNTSNTSNLVYGSLWLAGGNNVTLSQVSGAGAATITISAANETQTVPPIGTAVSEVLSAGSTGTITRFAPEDHAHRGVNLIQISGNTVNTSNVVYGSVYLAGGNNITLSQVSAAGKATITISAANETQTVPPIATAVQVAVSTLASTGSITRFAPEDHLHQGINSAGISNVGNTSGTSGAGPGRLVLAGGNNITLSQATDGTGSTISVSGGVTGPIFKYWDNWMTQPGVRQLSVFEESLWIFPMHPLVGVFPGYMTANTLNLHLSYNFTNTSASTEGQSATFSVGFYTSTGNTLSLLNSASTSFGFGAASDMSSNFHGARVLSFDATLFASSLTFTPGPYWGAVWWRSSGTSQGNNMCIFVNFYGDSVNRSGTIGTSLATNTTMQWRPFAQGKYSVSFSSAMPSALSMSDINHGIIGPGNQAILMQFNNITASF